MGVYRNKDGLLIEVDDAFARTHGYTPVSDEEQYSTLQSEAIESRGEGTINKINAAATGLLSGATLGLSDVALGSLSDQNQREQLQADREANAGIAGVAEATGAIAGAFAAPGSFLGRTPAGYLSRAAEQGIAASRAAGGVKAALGTAAFSGGEAALQSAGSYLSDIALGDRDLTAEGMAGALGRGFGFGALAGGAVYGVEKGTIAARRMFSHVAEGGGKAATLAEEAWKRQSDDLLSANQANYEKAKARLAEIQSQKRIAEDLRMRADADLAQARLDDLKTRGQKPPTETPTPSPAPVEPPAAPMSGAPEPAAPTGLPDRARTRGYAAAPEAPPAPAAGQTLEQRLGQMQDEINAGATLQDLNAQRPSLSPQLADEEAKLTEAVTAFESRKQAVDEWINRIKNPRTTFQMETPGLIRSRRYEALPEDVFVEQSGGRLYNIGKGEGTLDNLTPNSRILAGSNGPDFRVGSQLDQEYEDALELARTAEVPEDRALALQEAADIEQQIHAYVRNHKPENAAVIDRIEQLRAEAGITGVEAAEKRVLRRTEREAEALANTQPKPSIVDETHDAATVLGEYEKASADLADALGDGASAASKEARDAFRKAEAEAERKAMDGAARAADNAAEEAAKAPRPTEAPPIEAPRTPAERIAAAKQAKAEANVSLKNLAIDEKAARADVKSLTPKKPPKTEAPKVAAPTEAQPSRFAKVADLGAVLEAADTLGIPGLPRPSDLPIVGPILGAYLKFRALKAVAGRMTGRVPATAEAKAAALASKTKDRAAKSVDKMLGFVERAAPKSRKVAVAAVPRLADVFSRRIFDDGEPDAPEEASAQEKATVRARELAFAVANPQLVIAQVRREMRDVTDPDLVAAAEKHRLRAMEHLNQHAPKGPPSSPLIKRPWVMSLAQAAIFARRLAVYDDPVSAIEAVEQKTLTPEAADTMRALNPRLFEMMRQRTIERSSEIKATLPYDQRLRMSRLFDVPLDPSVEPETIALLQSVHQASATTGPAAPSQNAPPMPSIAGPVDLTALYQPPADRRAARR